MSAAELAEQQQPTNIVENQPEESKVEIETNGVDADETVTSDNESGKENGDQEASESKPKVNVPPPSINDENAFPALGGSAQASSGSSISWGPSMKTAPATATSSKNAASKNTIRSKNVQEAFNINSQVSLNVSKVEFGKIINELKKTHGVSIESTLSSITKNRSFIVTGKPNDVGKVRKELVRRLTKPVSINFKIPSRTRAAVIGASGRNLKPILESTGTRINIDKSATPGPSSGNDDFDEEVQVTIDGDVDGVDEAKQRILAIVNEETKNLSTKITVPEDLVKFFKPININEENLKISGPNKHGVISISGARDDVLVKKSEISTQLDTLRIKIKTETKSIPKKVHQFIKPDEIYSKFNVVITLPKGEIDDEELVSFNGLPSDIQSAIQYARNTTSQFVVDTLDISRAHGGNVDHARALAAYFAHAGLLESLGKESNTIISTPPYHKLVSRNLKNVNIDISAPKDSAQSMKDSRKKIVDLVNSLTPSRVRYVTDIVPFFSKRVSSTTESSAKAANVHVVPLSQLAENKTNEIILIALDNEEDEFAPSQEEIDSRLDKVNSALDALRKAQSELKSTVLDVPSDKQQFIEGPNGTTLKTLINSFEGGSLVLKLHYNGGQESPDKVYIQGSKTDVTKAEKEINSLLKDAEDLKDIYSYQTELKVPTTVLPRLIGKNGANLTTLRDQFGVSIDVEKQPTGEKASLTITGYKFNVKEAEHDILQSSKRWADEVTKTVIVPQKYHGSLIGSGGQYVKRLQDKYNVRILFTNGSDDVVIRGPSRGAVKAEEEVKELVDYLIANGYTKELEVPTKALSRVIGKNGETMKNIAADSDVEIDVQKAEEGSEISKIVLTGSRKGLKDAETKIMAIVKEVEETVSIELDVDPKYFRDILGPRGSVKSAIIEKAGGADDQHRRLLQIPDQDSKLKKITSTGPKPVVESIIQQVKEIVQEKENSVTEKLEVSKDKHRFIIGPSGSTRRTIESENGVTINIPNVNSDSNEITIFGLPENVEKAKAKINELTVDDWKAVVDVPSTLHAAVSERGAFTRKLRLDYNVEVEHGNASSRAYKLSSQFPTPPKSAFGSDEETIKFSIDESSQESKDESGVLIPWRLKGTDEDVSKVEKLIKSRLEQYSKDDTSAYLWVKNPSVFGKVVGPQGSRLNNIKKKSGSQIYVPRNSDKINNVIYLKGTKESLEKAEKLLRAEIEKK